MIAAKAFEIGTAPWPTGGAAAESEMIESAALRDVGRHTREQLETKPPPNRRR